MADLPNRCFGGSVEEYLAAQGYDAELRSTMLAGVVGSGSLNGSWDSGVAVDYGRADVFRGSDGYRVIELNMGSPLGGRLTTTMNGDLLRTSAAFGGFATEFGLTWADPVQVLADDLVAVGRTTVGTDAPVVAVIEETGTDDSAVRVMEELRARNVNAIHGEFGDLDFVDGKARLRGRPIDIGLRYFFVRHIPLEPQGLATLRRWSKHAGPVGRRCSPRSTRSSTTARPRSACCSNPRCGRSCPTSSSPVSTGSCRGPGARAGVPYRRAGRPCRADGRMSCSATGPRAQARQPVCQPRRRVRRSGRRVRWRTFLDSPPRPDSWSRNGSARPPRR